MKHEKSQQGGSKLHVGNIIDSLNINNEYMGDMPNVVLYHKNRIDNYIQHQAISRQGIKVSACISVNFSKPRNDEEIYQTGH